MALIFLLLFTLILLSLLTYILKIMNRWFSIQRCKDTGSLLSVLPSVCLQYFKSLKCAHIYFCKKINQSILGNLSWKLCRASRGGASLHNYNFLLLYTFALQRKTSNQCLFASVCTVLVMWTKSYFHPL